MIQQDIHIPKHNWDIRIYYEVTSVWGGLIVRDLIDAGIKGRDAKTALSVVKKSDLNTGLTFSNYEKRRSVVVVFNGSNGAQFFNSMIHEALHVQRHICEADGVDPYSEDAAYILGDMAGMMYPKIKGLLCGCSKHKGT
jgi:hypothetical protein